MTDMPRDDLFRAVYPGVELRDTNGDGWAPTMTGHLAVFNEWTEINSIFEGRFIERLAPGAFAKTIKENTDKIRVLFQHGQDPQVGDKPLGPIESLREDDKGVAYDVQLLDTAYNRELLPGLKAGLYGASFRFKVMKEEIVQKPKRSAYNPEGLPERTISEVQMREFGPVTFPAYDGATAGIRSVTDLFRPGDTERSTTIDEEALPDEEPPDEDTPDEAAADEETALDTDGAEETHSAQPSRATANTNPKEKSQMTLSEKRARVEEIKTRMNEIVREFPADRLDEETQVEWDTIVEEKKRLDGDIADAETRMKMVEEFSRDTSRVELGEEPRRDRPAVKRSLVPDDPHDLEAYRERVSSLSELSRAYHEGAKQIVDRLTFPHPEANREDQQEHIEKLLNTVDGEDRELARRIIQTSSPTYQRAFGKHIVGKPLSPEEQRALGVGSQGGNYPVPITMDPTVILTSNGVVNPLRQISRVVTITGNTWNGVASTGITASYAAESTETSDNSPTLTQPTANVEKAQAFVPFSIEVGEDWASLQSEMARLLQDAKDTLEADKFLTGAGHGSNVPEGLLVGGTAYVNTAATATFAVADVYSLEEALPPRFRPRANFVLNRKYANKIRQFDTAGGASMWVQLQDASPPNLIGYPAREYSDMSSAATSGASIVTIGDFSHFLIVDRVGMNIELVPHLFGTTNNYPTGQRGLYAYWRNTSDVLAMEAFRTLVLL